ncbi:MAG: hypothetical protein R2739_07815 [Chitinophagales bacterium]|nr:hypothetical protein [Bacteroidota bacterium]
MEQTLTYNRKALIASFEKATNITHSVKIDSVLEAKQIINHLLHFLEIKNVNKVEEDFITPDFNKDTIKIRFTSSEEKLSNDVFLANLKIFNDYIFNANKQ